MESESQFIDIARVSGFMQKVCLLLSTNNPTFLKTGYQLGSQWCDIVTVEGRTRYTIVACVLIPHACAICSRIVILYSLSHSGFAHNTTLYTTPSDYPTSMAIYSIPFSLRSSSAFWYICRICRWPAISTMIPHRRGVLGDRVVSSSSEQSSGSSPATPITP